MQSTGEGGADLLIKTHFFPEHTAGIFVDVGAAHPNYLSMSQLFHAAGWRVLSIEPNPAFCQVHRDAGREVLQYACGDRDQDDVDFSVVDSHGTTYRDGMVTYESFSSLSIKPSYKKLKSDLDVTIIKVKLRRLDTILHEHAPDVSRIDILSVDVEGWELEVLKGLSVSQYRPAVMVLENLFAERRYQKKLKQLGYKLWRRVEPNDIYIPA